MYELLLCNSQNFNKYHTKKTCEKQRTIIKIKNDRSINTRNPYCFIMNDKFSGCIDFCVLIMNLKKNGNYAKLDTAPIFFSDTDTDTYFFFQIQIHFFSDKDKINPV